MPSAEGSTPQNAEGVSKRPTLSRKQWNAEYRADRERIYTVLTIDGGGMRGMIPACVLEEVETAIKEKALTLLKESVKVGASAEQRAGFNAIFQLEPLPAAKDIPNLTYHDIHVDLADFFDLISGTSTGAILAAYLATKGGNCSASILESKNSHYQDQIAKFKFNRREENQTLGVAGMALDRGDNIDAGEAAAVQALFAATGDKIFTKVGGMFNPANWRLGPIKLIPGLGKLEMLGVSLYGAQGIQDVLGDVLKDTRSEKTIKMSDESSLHCSLLIPSFQIDHNRPVMFWHLHQGKSMGGSGWGYSTVNRLRPFEGLEVVDEEGIVAAVAQAMAGPELLAGEHSKPFPSACAEDVLSYESDRINTDALEAWDAGYQKKLAVAVCSALPELEGFDKDDLAEVIERALLLLKTSRFATFRDALTAAIVPQLRPDMDTSMYVLKKTPLQTEQAAQAAAQAALQAAAQVAAQAASQAAVQAEAEAGAQAGGQAAAAAPAGRANWVAQSAQAVADGTAAALQAPAQMLERIRMWGGAMGGGLDGVGGLLKGSVAVRLPKTCRFYEAQCGDSVHVYNVDFNLCEVVRASTAAPTFFSAAKLSSQGVGKPPRFIRLGDKLDKKPLMEGSFADGGVVANNPTMAAIAFLERAYGVHRSNIAVLSLGCGSVTGPVDVGKRAGGLFWALPLISQVFMGSSIDTVTAVTEMMFTADTEVQGQQPVNKPSRYLRIQAVGFAPPGWMQKLGTKLRIFKKKPQLQMHTPIANNKDAARKLRRSVNYLGIVPSSSSSVSEAVGSSYTNSQLGAALQAMDRPEDWDKLRVIGSALGQHFKEDIRAWLDTYVLNSELLQQPGLPSGTGVGSKDSEPQQFSAPEAQDDTHTAAQDQDAAQLEPVPALAGCKA